MSAVNFYAFNGNTEHLYMQGTKYDLIIDTKYDS